MLVAGLITACVLVLALRSILDPANRPGAAAATATTTPAPPALSAFPPDFTPPAPGAASPESIPPAEATQRALNGQPIQPGWGLWTRTPPPPPPPAPTGTPAPPVAEAAPPPGWPGGAPPPYGWYPRGGKWGRPQPLPAPTLPPGALPFGVQPGYRCADGFYITQGEGDWQWFFRRYVVDGETIIDRLGGPANRPTIHTGCKRVP